MKEAKQNRHGRGPNLENGHPNLVNLEVSHLRPSQKKKRKQFRNWMAKIGNFSNRQTWTKFSPR